MNRVLNLELRWRLRLGLPELAVHVLLPVHHPRGLDSLTVPLHQLAHPRRQIVAHLSYGVKVGEQLASPELRLGGHRAERLRGGQERVVAHLPRPRQHRRVAQRREHVRVVRLRRVQGFAAVGHRRERAPRRENRAPVRPRHSLLKRALRLGRGVGQGHDDRAGVQGRHLTHHPLVERAVNRGDADEHGGFYRVNRGEEVGSVLDVVRECHLVRLQRVPRGLRRLQPLLAHQPLAVHEVAPVDGVVVRHAALLEGHGDELADAHARLTGAVE
mmetsp:Transcript_4548/g.18719  ORF Transcript_4548/g.18719 Transcript_4548/m.18719 type:complete len:272 (+) Transcript_4548:767-1582(+)